MSNERMRAVLAHLPHMDNPPEDQATAVAMIARQALLPFSDDMEVDTGFGFGEACLDFWMDGKAVRVIVKRVPTLDMNGADDEASPAL